jgi:uncharacterized membrane protein YphA (DoxX/SURF4 family)
LTPIALNRFKATPVRHAGTESRTRGSNRTVSFERTTRVVLTLFTRFAPAGVFLVFGADEFVNHGRNTGSFALYGLPDPSAFSYSIGSLEIVGALALLSGIALLPSAVALAGDMVGAIVVSGIGQGELVSLTLAPAMLVAMLTLIACELSDRRVRSRSLPWSRWRSRRPSARPG